MRVKEIDLYQQRRDRVFKVRDYQFSIEESKTKCSVKQKYIGSEYFDEVGCWLKRHGFFKYNDICK